MIKEVKKMSGANTGSNGGKNPPREKQTRSTGMSVGNSGTKGGEKPPRR